MSRVYKIRDSFDSRDLITLVDINRNKYYLKIKSLLGQSGVDLTVLTNRIENLENNEVKVTYREDIPSNSGTAGSITIPQGATIATGGFPGNAILSTTNSDGEITGETPRTTSGEFITANLDTLGNYTLSSNYFDANGYPLALIYQIIIKEKDLSNLDKNKIIDANVEDVYTGKYRTVVYNTNTLYPTVFNQNIQFTTIGYDTIGLQLTPNGIFNPVDDIKAYLTFRTYVSRMSGTGAVYCYADGVFTFYNNFAVNSVFLNNDSNNKNLELNRIPIIFSKNAYLNIKFFKNKNNFNAGCSGPNVLIEVI
jgi:hypothetical protein